ncbi:MAG: hypothetical protein J3Q66DRAFT_417009 [Benniella sp.]|nr:MAG: hypothetical protein J3Q66DRAFT_417009 [Benniella sp.]
MTFVEKPMTAVIFLGNIGAGKSTLLSQLTEKDREFPSGISFMSGLTKEVSEQTVYINGERVILMDTPGLYEISNQATKANAEKLTEALRKGYNYKIFFVLKATNRGLASGDLALMSNVNKSVRQVDGAKVEYQVIINQIEDDETYEMYVRNVANDNFRRVLESLDPEEYDLDIQLRGVILIRSDKAAVKSKLLKDVIIQQVQAQTPVQVQAEPIVTDNKDLNMFDVAASFVGRGLTAFYTVGALSFTTEAIITGSVVAGVAGIAIAAGALATAYLTKNLKAKKPSVQ